LQEIIKYDNIGLQYNNVHTKLRAGGSGVEMDSHKNMTWYCMKHIFFPFEEGKVAKKCIKENI
jgi:hypothetical protein